MTKAVAHKARSAAREPAVQAVTTSPKALAPLAPRAAYKARLAARELAVRGGASSRKASAAEEVEAVEEDGAGEE